MNEPKLRDEVVKNFNPFLDDVLKSGRDKVHSIHITGSALTDDFDPKRSDINSVVVLKEMDLKFLEHLAPLGKKYGKKRVSAPLIMAPDYISNSLDVFPIEFFNIKMIHRTVFGEDIFQSIEIKRDDLRHQCERELKVRLIGLRQGYIASSGDRKILTESLIDSLSGYIPLFRGIILLLEKEPPIKNYEVMTCLEEVSGVDMDVFKTALKEKKERGKLSMAQLNTIFEEDYQAIEKLGEMINAFQE